MSVFICSGAGGALAIDRQGGTTSPRELITTLEQLEFPDGITFSEIAVPSERSLLFPVPAEMANQGGEVVLYYRCAGDVAPEAALGVTINDEAELLQPLQSGCAVGEWRIRLDSAQLAAGQVKLLLRAHWQRHPQGALSLPPTATTLRISPLSALTTYHNGEPRSLRDAWLALPEQVTLSIPHGELTAQEFQTALEWVRLLLRHHHQVRVVTLPKVGDWVMASHTALTLIPGGAEKPFWKRTVHNLGVVTIGSRSVVVATRPYVSPWGDELGWLSHESSLHYQSSTAAQQPAATTVTLESIGLSSESALFADRLQWSAYLTPWHLPPGMRPVRAVVNVSLPRTARAVQVRFFFYLNDRMVQSRLLEMDGQRHSVTVPLQDMPMNESHVLRIVAVRLPAGGAVAAREVLPVTIEPQSHLELITTGKREEGLSALPTRFGRGIDLHLPAHYLSQGERYLVLLGRVMNGFVVPQGGYQLQFHEQRMSRALRSDFIAAAELLPEGETLPLRFDRGAVEMVGRGEHRLIDAPQLRSSTLLQLKWHGRSAGLWVTPGDSGDLPALDVDRLGGEDVAIYGPRGLRLSFNSHYKEMAHPTYRDYSYWYGYLVARRYQVLLAIWLLMALAIFYLYRKSKYHHSR